MNVLVLCDRIPSSYQDGLTLRILHYVRRLCPQHRFDLVCFRTGVETDEVRTLFRHIWMFERPERRAGGALRGWVPESLYPYSHPLAAFLETELDPANYDVVWDAACCLAPHLPDRWKAVPYFGDLVDEMVLALWNRLKLARSAGEAARMFKYLVLNARFERRYLGPAALCTVVSEVDAAML
ncbi:MAG: hypothetical protein KIT73_09345, partial [Burkholderiales bacterium]|nr:hypothetical protein [Burkholderiales bacterium]